MSPSARNRNATPRTPPANPAAAREFALSCTVTAVTPANAIPTRPIATPTSIEPAAAYPLAIPSAATTIAAAAFAIAATIRAAVRGACRPTTFARTTSARPLCSSARVCRATRRMFIRAARMCRYRA